MPAKPAMPQRPTPRLRAAAAAALLAALAGPAAAQSLQELYLAARAYDATYLAARAQAESVTYRRAQADALRRPSLSAQAQAARSGTRVPNPVVTPDNPQGTDSGYGNVATALINGRQPLFNRANQATIEQADSELGIAETQLELAEQDLIIRLSQAYFDVLVAEETLTTARAAKTAFAEQLASARRNFEVGTATITDQREAQARFDLATAREIQADNDLRSKRIALDQLVGRTGVAPRPLALPAPLAGTVAGSIDDWAGRAESSPVIRRAQLGVEIAEAEADKARAGHLPTVDLVGQLRYDNNSGVVGLGTGVGRAPGDYANGSIGLQITLPVYSGGAVSNRVREVASLIDKSRNDLDNARRAVVQQTRQAYIGFRSLEAEVRALEAAESSSKLALEATQLGFRVGVRVNLDVLNAQTQLFQTQRDLAKARYDTLFGGLRLRQAAGVLGPADVEAVDRLLAK